MPVSIYKGDKMTNYVFKAGNNNLAPLLLLHSTGGDEHQLLAIADQIAPTHPILSIRGRINQQGSNRYFKLHGSGGFTKANFDLESLNEESSWLADEIVRLDRKSTRLNSSHHSISYAVFCLKKK